MPTLLQEWMPYIILVNVASGLMMAGIVWFVQLVHYPLFRAYSAEGYRLTMQHHQQRTAYVVIPIMLVELFTSAIILIWTPETIPLRLAGINAAIVAILWLLTFLVQAPLHRQLLDGPVEIVTKRLVYGNFLRVILWSVRAVTALAMVVFWYNP